MAYYWQLARDSLLTDTAIRILQIAAAHDGEDFDHATDLIDAEFGQTIGHGTQRHGGLFQTYVQVFQEAGWIDISDGTLRFTAAGLQALTLLGKVPDMLKVIPHFLVELLARYQISDPARPPARNEPIAQQRQTSDVFPYWTIWKIMRSCENRVTTEELRRFVLQLHDSADIQTCINDLLAFRHDRETGVGEQTINSKYPPPLQGAVGEPKYVMARAGTQIGRYPPLIVKPTFDSYQLHPVYLPLIDEVLANEPVFKDYPSADSWMAEYGRPVELQEEVTLPTEELEDVEPEISADDPIHSQVQTLLKDGANAFMLSGPPGTSKSWYARQIAYRLTNGDRTRVKLVQFHPSFGYEDFVEGYVPVRGSVSQIPTFSLMPKIFLEAARRARESECVVLVIDEFSRGDVGRVFGEILTYLEPDYREQRFTLASGRNFAVPKNLYIIATMNPYDRSVADIDVAIQRRFEVIAMKPNKDILRGLLLKNEMDDQLAAKVLQFFEYAQDRVPLGGLGHTYFLRARDGQSLERIWEYNLKPLLERELRYEPDVLSELGQAFRKMLED